MEVLLLGLLGLPGGHGQIAAPPYGSRPVARFFPEAALRWKRMCSMYMYIYIHTLMHVDRTDMYLYICI